MKAFKSIGSIRTLKGRQALKELLEEKVLRYNTPAFIKDDPITIPHQFSRKQDIEIAGLFAAILAWGQRTTIINKCKDLLARMDYAPYDFVRGHSEEELKHLTTFKHRTFNGTDTLYFVAFLNWYYARYNSLEDAFVCQPEITSIEQALTGFHDLFFSLDNHPSRTRKHVPTPARKSTCKRLNMYLRWMVRKDDKGVDFGLWSKLSPADLICPCDLHVDRVARQLKLISRKQTDWQTAVELTDNLRKLDELDPVKYDFALFGMGIMEGWAR